MDQKANKFTFSPIGTIRTPFKQKFAIPRQPNLADAKAEIELSPAFSDRRVFDSLDAFSHIWLIFLFHETADKGWKAKVKAPRLGGNKTMGVFASRSTHRPNPIGMSVVKRGNVTIRNERVVLEVSGVDLLDGTPILDIKPYLPYSDCVTDATETLTQQYPAKTRDVTFSPTAQHQLHELARQYPDLLSLITATLSQDPRPAYRQSIDDDPRTYFVALYDCDIAWVINKGVVEVVAISPFSG